LRKQNHYNPTDWFYSYAHPWIKGNGQRGFNDEDIPKDDKRERFMKQVKNYYLKMAIYHEIGSFLR
jgi:oxygen-independent coproporphyrinogen-3 oxidase